MKKVLFLLTGLLFMLASCSSGGKDIPEKEKPDIEIPQDEASITCSITSISLDYIGGEKTLSFTANKNWTISVANGISWCTISQTAGSAGTFNVSVKVSENQEYDDRSVTISIKCEKVTHHIVLTQKQKDALLITTNKYEVSQEGGTIEMEVKANIEYQIQIAESSSSWMKEISSRGLSTHKHVFTVSASEEYDKREGEIYVKSGEKVDTIKVYQTGGAILLLSKDEYTVSDKGETISVEIKSNFEYSVQLPNMDWIKEDYSSRGVSSHTTRYIVSPNETYDSRSAEIIFYDKNSELKDTLKILQAQKDAIIISKQEYVVSAEENMLDFEISSNVDFTVKTSVDWIKQTTLSRNLESKRLYFTISENTGISIREGFISFIYEDLEQTVLIKQDGKEVPYVTFIAESEQTFTMSRAVSTLEYSVNDGEWNELGTSIVLFGGKSGNLRLRGKNRYGTGNISSYYSQIVFGNATPVVCIGDIRTLIDYNNYKTCQTSSASFSYLFDGCSNLISAPELPSTKLAKCCYYYMFKGCTSLTSAPQLPAITLSDGCYYNMFNGCKALKSAPKLPAETLADYCYEGMFSDCTSLVSAPELPATTLTSSCYYAMFSGCKSLVYAPKLPATTLAENCYTAMFLGCTNMVSAPKLPAITLADGCYYTMFLDCKGLVSAPELPATTLAKSCYASMFRGCTNLVNVPQILPATILNKNCYRLMFSDCITLKCSPILPATVLSESCYSGMFNGCANLISVPQILPATTLAKSCYSEMFEGCISLKDSPELPATVLSEFCYSEMFNQCVSLSRVPNRLPATKLAESCYSYMFSGCVNLIQTPILPAEVLANSCYRGMFNYCNNLNEITMLAIDITATNSLKDWVKGVSSIGTFIKAKNMTSLPTGPNGIPSRWIVVDYEE